LKNKRELKSSVEFMYPTPTLWFEIGVAGIAGIALLWVKVEYALFLYAFALGFPDFALPLGATINLRADDVLLFVLLARTIFWRPALLSRGQKAIFTWQTIFLAVCVFSLALESAPGSPPQAYDAAKMVGCAAIFFVLPRVVQSETRLRFFVAGIMCAGLALVIQVRQHLGANGAAAANFQQLKSAATFDTWNPNTIGQAAILLVFAAGLGWIIFSGSLANKILWPSLAAGFALVPAFVFVRGSTLSIAAGLGLFLCLLRRWKSLLVFAVFCLCAVLWLNACQSQLLEEASALNVSTGEGFSHRFDRWDMAVEAIRSRPFTGHGFGQELAYLTQIGSEGRAHDDLLTVWLELGLGGLVLFVTAIVQFVRAGCSLYKTSQFERHGAAVLALTLALCLDSLGLPTLYWEKLPTIALSLAAALVGVCERSDFETAVKESRKASRASLAQHSSRHELFTV
jgi:O-antigen ligase